MNKAVHFFYVWTMVGIIVAVTIYLANTGYSYYTLPLEERFYHDSYDWFKPSGLFGQGLGVIGTGLIAFGVSIYIAHKRYNILGKYVRLKYLLEFHIFLCTLGPILILFHTTFKFGGIVSIAFWSMVAVVASGVVGRFIYIQIPRNIQGKSLSLNDIEEERKIIHLQLKKRSNIDITQLEKLLNSNNKPPLISYFQIQSILKNVKRYLKAKQVDKEGQNEVLHLVGKELKLSSKIGRLEQMQKFFKYWHVIHMPFALIMLIIVIIHVIVTVSLGYKWIF